MEGDKMTIDKMEEVLAKEPFLGGNLPAEADRINFESLKEAPEAKFLNTRAWYYIIKAFAPAVRMKWVKKEEKGAKKEKKPKEEPKKVEEEVAEDDIFGGDEDLEAAKKALEEKKKEDEKKKKEKKKEAAKSYIRFEVKVFDTATDLDKLAHRIYKDVNMDGLKWEKSYNKEPFAFGVEKLIISCIIEDEKVSSEDIIESIQEFDEGELVQSVDILVFNKLQPAHY
eukprot:TRINITY_DN120341_c0_g1_i1.p3 TRINITY_DN120341_c0_g1~~TRINITY_DN120341_c0_g1_i1.p3  ORF type:complete len:226 (+),score=78.78 TRINITY_DN120341_c0_g1_i1:1188-1865(+)